MIAADEIAREMEAIAHDAERISALSRTQPHLFCEQKDLIARRLRKLACELRNTFGGMPVAGDVSQQRHRDPTRTIVPGRRSCGLRVEIRRTRAA